MPADDWQLKPSNASAPNAEPRVLEVQFGRGNRQVMAEGGDPDNVPFTFEFVTNNVDMDVLKVWHDFLVAKGGWQSFTFTMPAPYDSLGQKRWICKRWRGPWNGGRAMTLSAMFEEVFF